MTSRVPLRLRVALAFALTTAVALTGLGAFVYLRVQDTLRDQTEQSLRTQTGALSTLSAEQRVRAVKELTGTTFAQVLSPAGELLASSPQLAGPLFRAVDVGGKQSVRRSVRLGGSEAEPALLLTRRLDGQVLVVGRSLEPVEDALDGVRTQFLLGLPLALLVASAVGYGVAGAALRPVERMRRQAATISQLDAQTRLPLPIARDEMHRLGTTLNAMLDRLDAAASRERNFVAEASHELRTPLALLRMELDLALARPRTPEELLTALESASEEVERLTALAEDLLLLADSEDDARVLESVEIPVEGLLREVARRFAPLAGRAGRRISVAVEQDTSVRGDPDRLGRALGNLAHNALLHGEGEVTLRARVVGSEVVLSVEDEGPGVPPEVRERAFDQMSRAPGARSARGHGLGLAIVRVIVEEHGGTVRILAGQSRGEGDEQQGRRSALSIRLPGPDPG
jgi:signal transduction histidine kinase